MGIARLSFLVYFSDVSLFDDYFYDVLKAFIVGLRYDAIVASYLILPLFMASCLLALFKSVKVFNFMQLIHRLVFVMGGAGVILLLICDYGFYSYFQDHINILFFGLLEDDTKALIQTIQTNYPVEWFLSAYLLIVILFIFTSQKIFSPINKKTLPILQAGFFKYLTLVFIGSALLVGGLRGGYGLFVIAPKYSDFSENEFINQLSYNGIIALEQSIRLRIENNREDFDMATKMGYGDNIHQAFTDYLGFDTSASKKSELLNLIKRKTIKQAKGMSQSPHVIVIVMESFGSHWLNYHSLDFNLLAGLEKHFEEDYLFSNILSSENGTIGSLMALASNMPPRPGKRYLSESKYMYLKLRSAAHVPYEKSGYESSFIYGGKLSWRNIGRYFKTQGFTNTIGENKITKELKLSGTQGTEWGLYDEHFFNYIYKKLIHADKPQFMMALSTSNHPPFEIPSNYKQQKVEIPKLLDRRILRERDLFIKRFKSYQYANQMLSNFISKIKNSVISDQTIIAVTGDHNFWGFINYQKNEAFSKYRVPFYLYVPSKIKMTSFKSDKVGSHEDIMPTLYNLSLSEQEYISFGEDLLSDGPSYAINSSVYASKDQVVYKGTPYGWQDMPLIKTQADQKIEESLKKLYRSVMSVSDFFLESEFSQTKKN